MKKIIIIAGVLLIGLGSFVRADTTNDTNNFYYVFHLYYDTDKLVVDRDFKFSYDIIPGEYVASSVGQFPYHGEVVNFTGEVTANFKFDVQSGKLSVNAPYVADGQKVIFYDNQNQPVLTIPVSDSSFCNDDGICNVDRGEDSLSCPKDCKQSLVTPLPTTPTPPTGGSGGLIAGILYALAGLGLIGLVWWLFKRRRNSNNMTLPPPSLPTPPPPAGGSTGNFPSQQNQV